MVFSCVFPINRTHALQQNRGGFAAGSWILMATAVFFFRRCCGTRGASRCGTGKRMASSRRSPPAPPAGAPRPVGRGNHWKISAKWHGVVRRGCNPYLTTDEYNHRTQSYRTFRRDQARHQRSLQEVERGPPGRPSRLAPGQKADFSQTGHLPTLRQCQSRADHAGCPRALSAPYFRSLSAMRVTTRSSLLTE